MTTNRYNRTRFLLGVHNLEQLPADKGKEVAFAGRSNVGKSSVINVICGNRRLARTSKTPGRTRQINFFELEPGIRLVDLPGYGYARVPGTIKHHWATTLQDYFDTRRSLVGLILIMDIRHPLKPHDRQMLAWSGAADLPVHILLNKADKISRSAATKVLQTLREELEEPITATLFSVNKGQGTVETRQLLDNWLGLQ